MIVNNPIPPISIKHTIITCPKNVYVALTTAGVSPVSLKDEQETNKASQKL
jgi:hypothetical protein